MRDVIDGPGATVRATASAMAKLAGAATAVLVEGLSDQIAVETAAGCRGRDLEAERVVVVPIGGAHAIGRFLREGLPAGGVRLAGLVDAHEAEIYRRALGAPDLERAGFFVCVDDLEDELIRALGAGGVEAVLGEHGDLRAFRTLQSQPAWRGRAPELQLRRFMGAGSRRKLRYARLLVEEAARHDTLPGPLVALLASISVTPPHGSVPSRLPPRRGGAAT
jgi:hypothetical protein